MKQNYWLTHLKLSLLIGFELNEFLFILFWSLALSASCSWSCSPADVNHLCSPAWIFLVYYFLVKSGPYSCFCIFAHFFPMLHLGPPSPSHRVKNETSNRPFFVCFWMKSPYESFEGSLAIGSKLVFLSSLLSNTRLPIGLFKIRLPIGSWNCHSFLSLCDARGECKQINKKAPRPQKCSRSN